MSAELLPHLSEHDILDIPSAAEQEVYRALRDQLPSTWLVIHSLEFIKETKTKKHSDREADFVIFAPEFGILVVEVKGGGVEYVKKFDKWYSIDRHGEKHEIKNPVRQAKEAKYEIARHMSNRLGKKQLLLAHAALFPDVYNVSQLASVDIPPEIIGGSKSLDSLENWIQSVFSFWAGNGPSYKALGSIGINAAKSVFGKSVSVNASLKTAIEKETKRQIELTKQQKTILRQLKRRKSALIEGGAGTGKTVLALDHAVSLASSGRKVLFLCYNQNLANSIKKKVLGVESLHAMSFHEFCSWRTRQAKRDTGRDLLAESKVNNQDANLYNVLMPDALINSYSVSPVLYDSIIIDEGQDFKDEYWLAVELLLDGNPEANFYVFQDCNQAIYTKCDFIPISSEPLYLFDNCRNTKEIHRFAYRYYRGLETEESDIDGEPVKFVWQPTIEQQASAIGSLVHKLIRQDSIEPEEIVLTVEGAFETAKNMLIRECKNINWSFKNADVPGSVLVETAKRFKGMESKLLIFWILDDSYLSDSLIYVATSRARLRLWVVCNEPVSTRLAVHFP